MSTFLPAGYEHLKTERKYWKMSEMKEGDNKLRIVMAPVAGWIDWVDNKPVRYRPENKPSSPFNIEKPIKGFWACYVWDYSREDLFILEISQASVIKAIVALANDSDWGDFTGYDLKINKTGSLMKTRYTVTALPHKPLPKNASDALKSTPVRLEALYEGGDPWNDLEGSDDFLEVSYNQKATSVFVKVEDADIFGNPVDELKERLTMENISTHSLTSYLDGLSKVTKRSTIELAENALQPERFTKFKDAYSNHIQERSA